VWETVEWYSEPSTIGVKDARCNYTVNGKSTHQPSRWMTRSSAYPLPQRYLFFDQVSNGTDAGPNYTYHTDIYIDDSWCQVFISDESAWTVSTTHSAQDRKTIPTAWADGQIQFVVRKGAHASLAGKYLYVRKSDETVLRIGRFS
jgi:hypothetical protein